MSKFAESVIAQPPLIEFLSTLPSPLTTALVGLAPYISRFRRFVQILSWKSSWEDSWLVLAAWWGLCLLAEPGLRYLLPPTILLLLFLARRSLTVQPAPLLVTEDTLQQVISDLTTLHALLPVPPLTSPSSLRQTPYLALFRAAAILYIPYLILTYCIYLRIIIALAGTLFLTWRARWALVLRRALWRSAHVRWIVYRVWSALSGLPITPVTPVATALAARSADNAQPPSADSPHPALEIRFLFAVLENQRWWMGLDWTAALLPGERPAWCAPNLAPASPPAIFSLPPPTTVYLPAPSELVGEGKSKGKGDGGGMRIKRTARWRWAEPEWRVAVHREGEPAARVERPVPKEEEAGAGSSAARMLKAAGKMREGSISGGAGGSPERYSKDIQAQKERDGECEDDEADVVFTDPDGWIYADNKWEGPSAKGGMGKYTRSRRWTRIAVLSETVELVGPGELGIQQHSASAPSQSHSQSHNQTGEGVDTKGSSQAPPAHDVTKAAETVSSDRTTVAIPPDWQPVQGRPDSLDRRLPGEPVAGSQTSPNEDDGLRKRLKAVVQSAAHS